MDVEDNFYGYAHKSPEWNKTHIGLHINLCDFVLLVINSWIRYIFLYIRTQINKKNAFKHGRYEDLIRVCLWKVYVNIS